jgi:hypothetical protein
MLYWTRAYVANQLAHSGKSWAEIFSLHHSGTYANQWMILDYNRYTPNAPLQNNLLTVLEEVPGYIHYDDMTSILRVSSTTVLTPIGFSHTSPFYPSFFLVVGERLLGIL